MEIICPGCQGKFKIDENKLPEGKAAAVKCPRCKEKFNISRPSAEESDTDAAFDDLFDFAEEEGDSGYDASEKPFDFIEEEGKTALLCEHEAVIREKLRPTLDVLEYHITEVPHSREALKNMRFHVYDLIVINEDFDSQDPDANPILIYLERQPMEIRRNIFVVMLSNRFRTMDQMRAFQKSVNMIVNIRNIDDFDKILQRGMADYGLFFKIFKESLSAIKM
jgi:predicted Zn finger-like uncharacterized protein